MKKLLFITLIAASLLTACGKDEEKKSDSSATATQTAQTTTKNEDSANTQANDALASQAPVTAEHTIDYATAATQEAIDETCEYFLKQQPDADPEATKSELAQLANYVLAANSLNLDRTESLKEVVTAMVDDIVLCQIAYSTLHVEGCLIVCIGGSQILVHALIFQRKAIEPVAFNGPGVVLRIFLVFVCARQPF